ncbi:MAG: hypothetical protein V3T70_07820 [Phycisphaerae bacterium]
MLHRNGRWRDESEIDAAARNSTTTFRVAVTPNTATIGVTIFAHRPGRWSVSSFN